MISRNRLFTKEEPTEEAKSIYIFCEGSRREFDYFKYFQNIDSRVNIEVYQLNEKEDNSPLGLLNIAKKCVIASEENPNPKYSFQENDEVWIVLDIDKDKLDSRKPQIIQILKEIKEKKDWFIARSNPCFEVWLYYHFFDTIPNIENSHISKNWKKLIDISMKGGFDPRKHPIYISDAMKSAKNNFKKERLNGIDAIISLWYKFPSSPAIGSTEVYLLAESICLILKNKIDKGLLDTES